jgi:hypothetical protein
MRKDKIAESVAVLDDVKPADRVWSPLCQAVSAYFAARLATEDDIARYQPMVDKYSGSLAIRPEPGFPVPKAVFRGLEILVMRDDDLNALPWEGPGAEIGHRAICLEGYINDPFDSGRRQRMLELLQSSQEYRQDVLLFAEALARKCVERVKRYREKHDAAAEDGVMAQAALDYTNGLLCKVRALCKKHQDDLDI